MKHSLSYPLVLVLVLVLAASTETIFCQDATTPPAVNKFEVDGHTAILYEAPEAAEGQPWVWYAPSLKGSLSLRQRTLYYEALMESGIALAGFDLGEVRGSPTSTANFTAFYDEMVRRGFSSKPILLGQSRGGIMMLAWATTHPDRVGAFVGIYPVCNLSSWPLTRAKSSTLADFGLPESEIRARLKQFNPLENLTGLANQRVPMFIVHGDSDKAVPLTENSIPLRDRYRAAGGPITLKIIKGEGHRVCPAFFECRELVDFVVEQATGMSGDAPPSAKQGEPESPQKPAAPAGEAEDVGNELRPLCNERYCITPQADGSLHIANADRDGFDVFRGEFTVVHCQHKPTTSRQKWTHPIYNLPAWQAADGSVVVDLFKVGEVTSLTKPTITIKGDKIVWAFNDERVSLTATVSLPTGTGETRIDYQAEIKAEGYYTIGYTGVPSTKLYDVVRLWQPQVWDGRRLPEQSFLIGDDHCSIPGCLVEHRSATTTRTVGVMADPWQFPYEMPNGRNRRFGVAIRNSAGNAQPMVFAPFPGSNTHFQEGDVHRFAIQLVTQPEPLSRTFEYVARNISGFRDQRENTLTTLNQTLDNMVDFSLSKWAAFDTKNKSSYYPDATGTVKNVSCLHPFSVALVTDNERLFRQQSVPIMEYLLSREKFLFAINESGLSSGQKPSMNLAGPAMPVSELAALHRLSRGASPLFLQQARRLYAVDRTLNMNWVTGGATWQRSLSLYRATDEEKWLDDAVEKANRYINDRIDKAPVDFHEAGDGTFFEYMIPRWKELYELYLETRDPRHLAAAHAGARRYAQFVWFYPSVPDRNITVNPRGLASRRGRADADGMLPVPKETVPAWQVADQGLICEGNGTVQRLGILLATHAPLFLRIARDTDDEFLRDIARSAVIGRYANFPGYHLNTRFSTAQEKPDFPLHDYDTLKPTTSIHYNHILPQINLVIDYLMSRAYDLSDGAIDFPTEFIEGYAYLQSKLYGAQPGSFYESQNVYPWMPARLIKISDTDVNYVTARSEDGFFIALMNSCDRRLQNVELELNPERFDELPEMVNAKTWTENRSQDTLVPVQGGKLVVSLRPKGITAIHIPEIRPRVRFQEKLAAAPRVTLVNQGPPSIAGCRVEASILTFGPKLRWVYAWLRSDKGKPAIESVEFRMKHHDGSEIKQSDNSFPFEIHTILEELAPDKELHFEMSPK